MSSRPVFGLVALGAALLVAFALAAHQSLEPVRPGSEEDTQLFSIEPGQGLSQVARNLELAGLILERRASETGSHFRRVTAPSLPSGGPSGRIGRASAC